MAKDFSSMPPEFNVSNPQTSKTHWFASAGPSKTQPQLQVFAPFERNQQIEEILLYVYIYTLYILLHLVAATVLIFFTLHLNNVGFKYTLIQKKKNNLYIYKYVYIYTYIYIGKIGGCARPFVAHKVVLGW